MKDRLLTVLLFVGTIMITFLLGVMYHQNRKLSEYRNIIENIDTTTVTKHDTIYETKTYTDTIPQYITQTITKRDTIYKDSTQHILTLESKTFENTLTQDGDTTTYKAYVSGYNLDFQPYPKLDSINLHTSHRIINTNTTTTQVITVSQKRSKWHLSPSVGVGYGVVNKQWDAFLGISLGYDIFN